MAKAAAASSETFWRVLHLPGTPPMSRFELAFVAMSRRYRIDRAKRDLGYAPIVSRLAGFATIRR
jgi:hypothetical protein